jgi:hypothetical protein
MRLVATLLIALATAAPAPPSSPSPSPRPGAEAPAKADAPAVAPRGQLANVRLDIKVTERKGGAEPVTKVISMTVADRDQGKIRSVAEVPPGPGGNAFGTSVPLHVDARPVIEGNRVRLRISLDYTADRPVETSARPPNLNVKEDLSVILENGRSMTIADAVDPMGDRRVQVEVTATILR